MDNSTPIKPYSKNELAQLYGVSLHTLIKWLHPFAEQIGQYVGRCYTPKQIKIIFNLIGEP